MFKLFIAIVSKDFKGEYSRVQLTVTMHLVEIKCHSHSFKKELNLAPTRVGTLEINEVIQIVFRVGPCFHRF